MADRSRHVTAYRCRQGSLYLHAHDTCPCCGGPLTAMRVSARARLVSHTTVRVNPTGRPYRLGVAVTVHGAATLCVVDGEIRGNGRDRVTLIERDGRLHARGALARVSRSPEPPATREDSQKS